MITNREGETFRVLDPHRRRGDGPPQVEDQEAAGPGYARVVGDSPDPALRRLGYGRRPEGGERWSQDASGPEEREAEALGPQARAGAGHPRLHGRVWRQGQARRRHATPRGDWLPVAGRVQRLHRRPPPRLPEDEELARLLAPEQAAAREQGSAGGRRGPEVRVRGLR